jgi:acetyl-CoA carboxylase biotin carboxyl carrier protein
MYSISADMAGKVLEICVHVGDQVEADQDIVVMESMKMQIPVAAPRPGRVTAILVSEGQFVNEGDPLVEFE